MTDPSREVDLLPRKTFQPTGRTQTLAVFAERFWSKVDKTDTCWNWKVPHKSGYGNIIFSRRREQATRVAWYLYTGEWPPDHLCVCHHCDNPPCVRKDHLFLGTKGDNARDAASKGRNSSQTYPERRPRGEKHVKSKLTDDDVRSILARHGRGESVRAIVSTVPVGQTTIRSIISGQKWRHIAAERNTAAPEKDNGR